MLPSKIRKHVEIAGQCEQDSKEESERNTPNGIQDFGKLFVIVGWVERQLKRMQAEPNHKMEIRAIVIDDEHKGRQNLVALLQRYCEEVEVVATAGTAVDGLQAIQAHDPDLVFIDVEMPLGTGFDLLSHAKPIQFEIVFVTGYSKYAEQAFDYDALHYIKKPIHPLRLQEAIRRYKARKSAGLNPSNGPSPIPPATAKTVQIALPTQTGSDVLSVTDIVKCKASGSYSEIHLKTGKHHIYAINLGELMDRLDPLDFHRVHNSWIVQRQYIRKYVRGKGGYIVLSDESVVDVSARRKKAFMDWLHG